MENNPNTLSCRHSSLAGLRHGGEGEGEGGVRPSSGLTTVSQTAATAIAAHHLVLLWFANVANCPCPLSRCLILVGLLAEPLLEHDVEVVRHIVPPVKGNI